ncbi:hypothetical protein AAVH_05412 [Aphelenchoides avenae]|nr:hypothetical protein AAVH_05412 [Aphelenchus avenae]
MDDVQDYTDLSYEEARQTLRKWREDHVRRSEETVEIWEHVLSRYESSLHDELWSILEQVTIAALDCARHDVAFECLQSLNKQFPHSARVTKLQAMRLESLRNYEDAAYLYDQLIKADETNTIYRKRKVAMLLAQGQRLEAIRELNEYLSTFVNDTEAWMQLSDLYLQESDYTRAAFCFEELILANPQNGAYLCRIAEIRYTLGGAENVELAKAYYERASRLRAGARALNGVILCCNYLLPKATPQKKKELIACGTKAADRLLALYAEQPAENPTTERQTRVVRNLKAHLKE